MAQAPTVNLPLVAKQILDFQNSPQRSTILNIKFGAPIYNELNLNISKDDSFEDTLQDVIASIQLFITNQSSVTRANEDGTITSRTFDSAKSRNSYIDSILANDFNKYLANNSTTGNIKPI
jgi:hypothetical protein